MHIIVIPHPADRASARQAGFSLVELMIAITLGMLLVAGLVATFVNSSRARDELERASQQIENGRYAMQVLGDDLRLAGYLGEFDLVQAALATPGAKPDPCATDVLTLNTALPLHIQGYDNGAALSCLSDVKSNIDIVVVRRASTCVSGAACPTVVGAPYFQGSFCNNTTELGSPSGTNHYRLDIAPAAPPGNLTRTWRDCTTLASTRQYLTRIYFVANNDVAGDGIPTLKRAELTTAHPTSPTGGTWTIVPIAQGIENLQLEYGIDANNDGIPDAVTADPDVYGACFGAGCVANWQNVVSVKINLLARNTSSSSEYTDTKTYSLGLLANGSANTVAPFNDRYKRHVFQAGVRLENPAGRRE
jgi:type IV pilus assembly protein PilW